MPRHPGVVSAGSDRSLRAHALQSLVTVEGLAVLTSIHHLDQLGISFLVPAILLVSLPPVLMVWFLKRLNRTARWTYTVFSSLMILGFGLDDGLWNHTIKMIVFSARGASRANMAGLPFPPVGSVLHEVTGVLAFVATLFAVYFGYRFLVETSHSTPRKIPG